MAWYICAWPMLNKVHLMFRVQLMADSTATVGMVMECMVHRVITRKIKRTMWRQTYILFSRQNYYGLAQLLR